MTIDQQSIADSGACAPFVCNQNGCEAPAVARFTWPGRDEAGICAEHLPKLRGVASAMGLHLQIISLPEAIGQEGE